MKPKDLGKHKPRSASKEGPERPSAVGDRNQTREFATTDFTDHTDESRKHNNPYAPAEVGSVLGPEPTKPHEKLSPAGGGGPTQSDRGWIPKTQVCLQLLISGEQYLIMPPRSSAFCVEDCKRHN